jgi:hypothetical protein
MSEFPTTGPVAAEIRLFDGRLNITAEDRSSATVTVEPMTNSDASRDAASRTTVEMRGNKLIVHTPELSGGWLRWRGAPVSITIHLPTSSSIEAKIASADSTLRGDFGSVGVNVASGDVLVDRTSGDLTVNSASGDLRVERVGGDLKVNSASGDVTAGTVDGSVTVHTASGDVEIGVAGGNVRANTASGDVKVGQTRRGAVKVNSASGDVSVGVLSGVGVWLDVTSMAGRARSELDTTAAVPNGQADLSLHLRSMSGDIRVSRA